MQPRQRSKCVVTVVVQRHRPVEARVHQVDAAARRVHLLVPENVGRAGRQAEAAVDAVGGQLADHAASTPFGSSSRRMRSTSSVSASPCDRLVTWSSSAVYATPAAGRTTASRSSASVSPSAPGSKRTRPRASRLSATRDVPRLGVDLDAADQAPARPRPAPRPLAASPRRARGRRRVEDVERARLELGAQERRRSRSARRPSRRRASAPPSAADAAGG